MRAALGFIYDNIYYIGIYTRRYAGRILLRLFKLVKKPLLVTAAFFYTIFKAVDRFVFSTLRTAVSDARALAKKARSTAGLFRTAFKRDPLSVPHLFFHLVKQAFFQHRLPFSYAASIFLPAAAAIVLAVTVSAFSSRTLALRVEYNGEFAGYITNESVLRTASEHASEKLNAGEVSVTASSLSENAAVSLASVKKSELCDDRYLADIILESAGRDYINACAVYINGEFLCAVSSECDAQSCFNRVLSERNTADENATVSFVEKIEFRQCLFPESSSLIWSKQKLYDTVSSVAVQPVTYTVGRRETLNTVLRLFDTDITRLRSLNANLGDSVYEGEVLTISPAISYLSTKVTYTNTRTASIPYETIEVETDSLYSGDTRTEQKGAEGSCTVTELVTYIDGVLTDSREIARTTLSEPVNEIIQKGTKAKSLTHVGNYTVVGTNGMFVWPVVGLYTIYSWFGYRNLGYHNGIDISGSDASGALIVAAYPGTVVSAGYANDGYGYKVIIDHGNGMQTLYGHALAGSIMVSVGDTVSSGQAIARVGNTGYSFGAHLHFEVRINGTRVDPAPYLGFE